MHHIHVYFTPAQKDKALALRTEIAATFPNLPLGRIHDKPVGPHPVGSYEVDAPADILGKIKIFLQQNHRDLTVMIHPVTGNDIEDHKEKNITWIGPPMKIKRSIFYPRPS